MLLQIRCGRSPCGPSNNRETVNGFRPRADLPFANIAHGTDDCVAHLELRLREMVELLSGFGSVAIRGFESRDGFQMLTVCNRYQVDTYDLVTRILTHGQGRILIYHVLGDCSNNEHCRCFEERPFVLANNEDNSRPYQRIPRFSQKNKGRSSTGE